MFADTVRITNVCIIIIIIMGQFADGSDGSRVTKCDPLLAVGRLTIILQLAAGW